MEGMAWWACPPWPRNFPEGNLRLTIPLIGTRRRRGPITIHSRRPAGPRAEGFPGAHRKVCHPSPPRAFVVGSSHASNATGHEPMHGSLLSLGRGDCRDCFEGRGTHFSAGKMEAKNGDRGNPDGMPFFEDVGQIVRRSSPHAHSGHNIVWLHKIT